MASIKVTISGEQMVGKTTIARILLDKLLEAGIDVTCDDLDVQFASQLAFPVELPLGAMSEKGTQVEISVVQINRPRN